MLVTGVGGGCPDAADHDVVLIRVAVLIHGVFGVPDLHPMLQVPWVRGTVKVFVSAQGSSPPINA